MSTPAAPCICARAPMGMTELAKRLGLQTAQGARHFIERTGFPHLRTGRRTVDKRGRERRGPIVVRRETWEAVAALAEEHGGDWEAAICAWKRRRREARRER